MQWGAGAGYGPPEEKGLGSSGRLLLRGRPSRFREVVIMTLKLARLFTALALCLSAMVVVFVPQARGGGTGVVKKVAAEVPAAYKTKGMLVVAAKGGPSISTLADLCGHTVAVERGTTQASDAAAQNASCKKAGKPGVTVAVYPDQNSANLALSSGRAQVGMADSPVAAYIVKQSNGQFKLTGKSYNTAPYGIAIPKGSGLTKPFLSALKVLMSDGTYKAIL